MFEIQFKKGHLLFAVRALERVISERKEDYLTPPVKAAHFNGPGMEGILNYFVVVFKNLLQDVHGIIMQ